MRTFAIRDGVPFIGDRSFAWAEQVHADELGGARYAHVTRNFHLRFENGWLLSVTFGTGTYCENHVCGLSSDRTFIEEPEHAEVWGWWGRGESSENPRWPLNGGDIRGWQSVDEVLALIDEMQTWSAPESDAA